LIRLYLAVPGPRQNNHRMLDAGCLDGTAYVRMQTQDLLLLRWLSEHLAVTPVCGAESCVFASPCSLFLSLMVGH